MQGGIVRKQDVKKGCHSLEDRDILTVLFLCSRGRPVEADQGGRHTDLWASWWYKTLQRTEGTVGLLGLKSRVTSSVVHLTYEERLHIFLDMLFYSLCECCSQGGTPEADHLRLPGVSADAGTASETWKRRCHRQHFLWWVHGSCLFVVAKYKNSEQEAWELSSSEVLLGTSQNPSIAAY